MQDVTFTAQPGRIFGITGAVACGKSTLGKAFLCELPYTGSIQYGGREMAGMTDAERCGVVGYLGHDPELLSDSIRNNILLGRDDDAWKYLRAVCLEDEVKAMPNGLIPAWAMAACACPAGSSSAWLWPAHWPTRARCWCWMTRSRPWTAKQKNRFLTTCVK